MLALPAGGDACLDLLLHAVGAILRSPGAFPAGSGITCAEPLRLNRLRYQESRSGAVLFRLRNDPRVTAAGGAPGSAAQGRVAATV